MRAIEEWYIGYELDTNTTNSIDIYINTVSVPLLTRVKVVVTL